MKLDRIDFDASASPGNINNRAISNTVSGADATISFRLTTLLEAQGALMRLQRTGADEEGSLKLFVSHDDPTSVPEPAATAALGMFALVGLGMMKKKSEVSV